ncbi:MAG: hypothetical protein QNK38_02500, partial [Nitrospirota bacterium]|nr:hypothetical protein [Nitrospirota bacterium]MDX2419930.1 hypothetical protein [Nitrospirota bacterium]
MPSKTFFATEPSAGQPGRLAGTAAGWPVATAGKNELNTQHNLPVPYAVLMMSRRKNWSHRGR